jgi:uncharacterized protein YbaP (TraB family)
MDLEQIKYLPAELKDRYRKLEAVFNEPGWELIVELAMQRFEDARARQLSAQNWDAALLNRGAAHAYAMLANLRETTEQEFAAIADAERDRHMLGIEAEHE